MPRPQASDQERRYLELRLRRPTSAWPLLRLASVSAAIALCVTLVLRPSTGLFVFWELVTPLLPLLFLTLPGLWRNICPMAATNQLPRVLGITRALKLPGWLERHGYAIGVGAFLAIVASRRELFDENATAAALLIVAVLVGALLGGLAFRGKSGFCGSVCPLRGVQGLYGQAPLLEIENTHCRPCVGCTSNCPDLKPRTHFAHDLRDEDGSRGRYRRLFAGLFPGFVLAFYTAGGPALVVFPLASLGAFFLFESVARARVEQVAAAFAAAAFATFYWFNVPILAEGIGRLAGGTPPDWAIWEGRVLAVALAGGWLISRRRAKAALPAAAPLIPLPMAGDAAQPEPVEAPQPVARSRAVAGDPPVPVPDRRSRGRPMRRPAVTVMPEGDRFEVAPGTTLLEVAQQAGVEVQAGCRMGLCGCDPVHVLGGAESLSPPSEDEQATIDRLGFEGPTRLACCTRVLGDAVISLEPLLAAGSSRKQEPAPAVNGAANGSAPHATELKINPRSHDVRRVVIVGNGIAGVTAADHIRRHHAECEVELVTDERHPFYNRTGISRLISSRGGIHKMYLLPDSWYEERRDHPLAQHARLAHRPRRAPGGAGHGRRAALRPPDPGHGQQPVRAPDRRLRAERLVLPARRRRRDADPLLRPERGRAPRDRRRRRRARAGGGRRAAPRSASRWRSSSAPSGWRRPRSTSGAADILQQAHPAARNRDPARDHRRVDLGLRAAGEPCGSATAPRARPTCWWSAPAWCRTRS